MANEYGSDFMVIVDEDGTEYEVEVLCSVEYNGATYVSVLPAVDRDEEAALEVIILKNVEEDGENILCAIEDDDEYEAVNELFLEQMYEDEDYSED